jgi:hypothetical protein
MTGTKSNTLSTRRGANCKKMRARLHRRMWKETLGSFIALVLCGSGDFEIDDALLVPHHSLHPGEFRIQAGTFRIEQPQQVSSALRPQRQILVPLALSRMRVTEGLYRQLLAG